MVVVTGVGGTDDKTNTHKHASHTKGGTVDSAALEALTSGAASKLLATRYELTAQSAFLSAFLKKHSFDSQQRKGRSYLQSDETFAACGTGGSRRCLPWITKGQGSRTVRRRSTSGPTSSNSEDELEIVGDEYVLREAYAYTHGLRTLICHYTRAVRDSTARVSASDSGANPSRSVF